MMCSKVHFGNVQYSIFNWGGMKFGAVMFISVLWSAVQYIIVYLCRIWYSLLKCCAVKYSLVIGTLLCGAVLYAACSEYHGPALPLWESWLWAVSGPAGSILYLYYGPAGSILYLYYGPAGSILYLYYGPAGSILFLYYGPAGSILFLYYDERRNVRWNIAWAQGKPQRLRLYFTVYHDFSQNRDIIIFSVLSFLVGQYWKSWFSVLVW